MNMNRFFIFFMINIVALPLLKGQCDIRMYDIFTPKGKKW